MRTFLRLWSGQAVSLVGSALTSFALGVWVYQETGSVTRLGLVYLLVFLPGILVAPFTGALVDRLDRRAVLLTTVSGGLLNVLALAALHHADALRSGHVYLTSAVTSVLIAVQTPAFAASVGPLVGRSGLGRANGLVMLAHSVAQIAGPLAGGFLLQAVNLGGVLIIDGASYLIALISLLTLRLPRPAPAGPGSGTGTSTGFGEGASGRIGLLAETAVAWRYVAARHGLVALLVFYALLNFGVGFVDVLITPLVLGFASTSALGTVLAVGGLGMVIGSVTMGVWGGPDRRIHGVLLFSLILGLALCAGALRPNLGLIAGAAFVFLFCSAIINAANRSFWQLKVEPGMQGRVLSLENMVATAPLPIAYLLAGPAIEQVCRPLLSSDTAFAHVTGSLIGGNGPDRAIALLLLGSGILVVGASIAGYFHPRLRRADDELPDALPDRPVLTATEGTR
ncbi:MFS transporter [Plantactinospora sp. GCM10030261]|uniref:MFS transporter n=1 Tax=Plantactinospora sp. GCM10030261 TaxID=3273420 RepID=UPI003612EE6F